MAIKNDHIQIQRKTKTKLTSTSPQALAIWLIVLSVVEEERLSTAIIVAFFPVQPSPSSRARC